MLAMMQQSLSISSNKLSPASSHTTHYHHNMAMSADTIIGLVALLIMCFPAVIFLLRIARRYKSGTILPSALETRFPLMRVASDELSITENGMFYTAVS